jgi:hypothetical protein
MFWAWLLKYSSFLVTGLVSLAVSWIILYLGSKRSNLIYYVGNEQWVTIPQQPNQQAAGPNQQAVGPVGTCTLYLWNAGDAPAKEVHVGHHFLPANNVFPDIPRTEELTPGGTTALRFPVLPPKVLVSISYLYFHPTSIHQFLSYVGWEEGAGKRIPVMLQRVWPKWWINFLLVLMLLGVWVAINLVWSLIRFLWIHYYS